MIELKFNPKIGVYADQKESVEKLRSNWFGKSKEGKIFLSPEEVLYLINFQNAVVKEKSKVVSFNEITSYYIKNNPRLFIKCNAFRDWRDRGLIIKRVEEVKLPKLKQKNLEKRYPIKPLRLEKINMLAYWYPESFFSIITDASVGKQLFEQQWFGQFGVYKQERGTLLKLDFLETIFLAKHFDLEVLDVEKDKKLTAEKILNQVISKREFAKALYEIYEDWRLKGYVVKTGFKFGSHFRIYFPTATPLLGEKEEYVHSKHVLHVFPKEQKLLISEWARAVRVAHGVKKTFILGIPELKKEDYIPYPADFVAYKRKKKKGIWVRETPKDRPRYLLVAVAEDEWIGGIELASLLNKAKNLGLSLLLSITDRETAITYYVLNKIILPGSKYEYYEIEWMKP